jgi:hypothetical protein
MAKVVIKDVIAIFASCDTQKPPNGKFGHSVTYVLDKNNKEHMKIVSENEKMSLSALNHFKSTYPDDLVDVRIIDVHFRTITNKQCGYIDAKYFTNRVPTLGDKSLKISLTAKDEKTGDLYSCHKQNGKTVTPKFFLEGEDNTLSCVNLVPYKGLKENDRLLYAPKGIEISDETLIEVPVVCFGGDLCDIEVDLFWNKTPGKIAPKAILLNCVIKKRGKKSEATTVESYDADLKAGNYSSLLDGKKVDNSVVVPQSYAEEGCDEFKDLEEASLVF